MSCRADIYTGRWTFTYLGWAPLPRNEKILPQCLRESGYMTKAVVDTPFLAREGYGYDRGFVDFEWVRGQGSEREYVNLQRRYETDYCAPATMLAAERWLEHGQKGKFFLYVDTWDPHEPWDPPKYYTDLYYANYDGRIVDPCYGPWREKGVAEADLNIAHAGYCGEITMVDRWVGHLLDGMEVMGLMENTAIILTSDHGFYFGEHGQFGKAIRREDRWRFSPLYEEVTRIPLLIHAPGLKPMRNGAMVSSPDLMPTVLELAGLKIPPTIQGRSLVPMLEGQDHKGHEFVASSWPLYDFGDVTRVVDDFLRNVSEPLPSTVTSNGWALVYGAEGGPAELYNLVSDPKQEKNLIQEEKDVAKSLLGKFISGLEKAGTAPRMLDRRRCF